MGKPWSSGQQGNFRDLSGSGHAFQMFKNNHHDHKQRVEAMIKNINTISLEMKKMKELSHILLCDLNLHFGQPKKTEDPKEAETSHSYEETEIPDVALASISLSD
ncbi:putative uncharacterized protein C5orf58 homolog [Arvicola amphibius]|uniref:putative uncharacterized protein C5orf58 homolog n=1 Tax=Arvicola amphibius TaxID=1047088 RepID=UPI001C08532B|nr:putative uncharacterized protein C5orf58 homolog [Arvicola amphibius]